MATFPWLAPGCHLVYCQPPSFNPFSLPGGGGAGICTAACWYPDGRSFVGAGIQPNIRVRPTVADVRSGRDPALEAALKHLREASPRPGPQGSRR